MSTCLLARVGAGAENKVLTLFFHTQEPLVRAYIFVEQVQENQISGDMCATRVCEPAP
tara:strand:- start:1274 stop:1447 length:174 start_codon:yes stop_codon:yes gene_type:complete